ncbi:hypothetical protein BSKO_06640 [Bryopsis sp. KO-2023]|nr:hypothetical protein BSKO_06640 [Bryopsis sp. KO-2023]
MGYQGMIWCQLMPDLEANRSRLGLIAGTLFQNVPSLKTQGVRDDWIHILLIVLGISVLECGFNWLSKKKAVQAEANDRIMALEMRIADLQTCVDQLRKEKEEMTCTELAATKSMLSTIIKGQEEVFQKWQKLLIAQETKAAKQRDQERVVKVERMPSPPQTEFDFQESEGGTCQEEPANRPVDVEWLRASFAQYMENVQEEDVESGGCPSPDYGVCDRSFD